MNRKQQVEEVQGMGAPVSANKVKEEGRSYGLCVLIATAIILVAVAVVLAII